MAAQPRRRWWRDLGGGGTTIAAAVPCRWRRRRRRRRRRDRGGGLRDAIAIDAAALARSGDAGALCVASQNLNAALTRPLSPVVTRDDAPPLQSISQAAVATPSPRDSSGRDGRSSSLRAPSGGGGARVRPSVSDRADTAALLQRRKRSKIVGAHTSGRRSARVRQSTRTSALGVGAAARRSARQSARLPV